MASVRRIISILLFLLLAMPPCQAGDDQILIRVGSHVPERSIGIRRVIKPWMEAVAADQSAEACSASILAKSNDHMTSSAECRPPRRSRAIRLSSW